MADPFRVTKTDTEPNCRRPIRKDQSGIALMMVISAVAVLSLIVSEFAYIAQVGQMIAYGGMDQNKAHYLAKSGLKLSLLRLKAFKQGRDLLSGKQIGFPKSLLDKVWNMPLSLPLPTNIPGMTTLEKEAIEKFDTSLNWDGTVSMMIQPETSKFNLNSLLKTYAPEPPTLPPGTPPPPPGTPPTPPKPFDPESARESLRAYIEQILRNKSESDPDFASEYRDIQARDLVDSIAAWIDPNYERRSSTSIDQTPMKQAPFYSLSELRMLPQMDDELYALLSPNFTARITSQINVNTMQEPTLRALFPGMSQEDIKDFFKFRDNPQADNQFKEEKDFFDYLSRSVGAYQGDSINQLKEELKKKYINIITQENEFKIIVRAQVNKAVRVIKAGVSLDSKKGLDPKNSGLRITYMSIE